MPPACALLGIAASATPMDQPVGFLDLPLEIREMIYKLLMDRCAVVSIPDGVLPNHYVDLSTKVINCYYPAMLRVSKQVKNEYMAVVMPRMVLHANWRFCRELPNWKTYMDPRKDLPKEILSQLKSLDLNTRILDLFGQLDLSSAEPLIQAVPTFMPQLSSAVFTTRSSFSDRIWNQRISAGITIHRFRHPTGLIQYGYWKQKTNRSLASLVKKVPTLTVKARFLITCSLYSVHPAVKQGTREGPRIRIPTAIFAACGRPDKDTFSVDGGEVKFMGVDDDLISGDSNTEITMSGKDVLSK